MTTLPLDTESLLGELADAGDGRADPESKPANAGEELGGEPFDGLPRGTRMGHVHLCVADVAETIAFYRDVLGFALMAALGEQAAFLSAGGYHHHLGANTWESRGAGQPPEGSAALRHATVVLPSDAERERALARLADAGVEPRAVGDGALVADPCGNPILLVSAKGS
jgi:catechol 2,3-dioxygenase